MDPHTPPETSHSNYILSILGGLGSMLIVLFILLVAYIPNRPAPVDHEAIEVRKERLAELRSKERNKTTTYAWVNRDEDQVRIPVERAMQLAVQRIEAGEAVVEAINAAAAEETAEEAAPEEAAEEVAEEEAEEAAESGQN